MRVYLFLCFSFAAFLIWAKPERTRPVPPPEREGLFLVGRSSGLPMHGFLALWRVGGSARLVDLPRKGVPLELAPGMHRAVVLTEPVGAPESQPFHVTDKTKSICIEAHPRRTFRSWVEVLDESGRPLRNSWCANESGTVELFVPGQFGAAAGSLRSDYWEACALSVPIESADGWFELEPWREAGQGWERSDRYTLAFEGRSSVRIIHANVPAGDRLYSAVAVPIAAIRRAIRMPSGEIAHDATIHARVDAWLDDEPENPILVHVHLRGFRPLHFGFGGHRVAKLPPRTLQPLVRSPAK